MTDTAAEHLDADVDAIRAANAAWARDHHDPAAPKVPERGLAVVTCMDARLDPLRSLGLAVGDAHVIRNAGALLTDDVVRSLVLSQYALATRTILVIAHTDCGLLGHDQEATADQVEAERGTRPPMPLGTIDSLAEEVARSVAALRDSALLAHVDDVHGFVHDVANGLLAPVAPGLAQD